MKYLVKSCNSSKINDVYVSNLKMYGNVLVFDYNYLIVDASLEIVENFFGNAKKYIIKPYEINSKIPYILSDKNGSTRSSNICVS